MFKVLKKFDRSISGSLWKQLLWLIIFIAVVLGFWFSLSYLIFDDSTMLVIENNKEVSALNNGMENRFWGVLSHLFDPGNLYMATPELRIFALLIAFSGSLLLSGLLISSFSNSLERRIDKIKNGLVNYNFLKHYVIIGYNNMVPSLIIQLAKKDEKTDIVLHTSQNVPDVRRRLKTRLQRILPFCKEVEIPKNK